MLYHIETKENIWISSKNARYFKRIFENRISSIFNNNLCNNIKK